jgi:hypothetical protein
MASLCTHTRNAGMWTTTAYSGAFARERGRDSQYSEHRFFGRTGPLIPIANGTAGASRPSSDPSQERPRLSPASDRYRFSTPVTNGSKIQVPFRLSRSTRDIRFLCSRITGLSVRAQLVVALAGGVRHAASFVLGSPIAPGTLITMKGLNLANADSQVNGLPLPPCGTAHKSFSTASRCRCCTPRHAKSTSRSHTMFRSIRSIR